jgi:hypothetical protein
LFAGTAIEFDIEHLITTDMFVSSRDCTNVLLAPYPAKLRPHDLDESISPLLEAFDLSVNGETKRNANGSC